MYILDGIAYAEEKSDCIEVKDVKVVDDMMLLITFNNNEKRVFDATILKGGAFEPLKDKRIFEDIRVEYGVITWMDGEIDCAPEYMYENSFKY